MSTLLALEVERLGVASRGHSTRSHAHAPNTSMTCFKAGFSRSRESPEGSNPLACRTYAQTIVRTRAYLSIAALLWRPRGIGGRRGGRLSNAEQIAIRVNVPTQAERCALWRLYFSFFSKLSSAFCMSRTEELSFHEGLFEEECLFQDDFMCCCRCRPQEDWWVDHACSCHIVHNPVRVPRLFYPPWPCHV